MNKGITRVPPRLAQDPLVAAKARGDGLRLGALREATARALRRTLDLAFVECRLVGVDSGAPWCARRVDARASPQFVSALFDDYARHFEPMLVEALGYCAPAVIADAMGARGPYAVSYTHLTLPTILRV